MKHIQSALLASAMLLSMPAHAADFGGPRSLKDGPYYDDTPIYQYYFGIRSGATFPDDTSFSAHSTNFKSDYDAGYFISGVIGKELARSTAGRLRGDIEIGYNSAEVDAQRISGVGRFSGSSAFGRTSTMFAVASLYYDFETGTVFKPFIGAGGGIANVSLRNYGAGPVGLVMNDSDTAYAYHLTAGTNVALSASLDLEVAYRYFGTTGADFRATDGTKSSIDTHEHQVMMGLRQKF